MGKQVICYIQAFDCEDTIEAAMQSVLEQTYKNWRCFVLSNGNENTAKTPNRTFDVLKSFAEKDSRFVVLNKRKNNVYIYIPMLYALANRFQDRYICSLDADDAYQNDFFERGVAFAEAHDLDIVACGTEIILKEDAKSKDGVLVRKRAVDKNQIIKAQDFTRLFPMYKPFFNEMWGKIYRTELFGQQYNWNYAEKHFFRRFLPDTLFTIDNLSRSSAIGILSGVSHKFYQYRYRKADNATAIVNLISATDWATAARNRYSLYDTYGRVLQFLSAHGKVGSEVYEYMQAVLFGWFGDFYSRTLLPMHNDSQFAKWASSLVFHPKFDELMHYQDSGKYDNLRNYERRREFCELLYNTAVCQKAIRNSGFQFRIGANLVDRPGSLVTQRKINRVVQKLENTMQVISEMQKRGE